MVLDGDEEQVRNYVYRFVIFSHNSSATTPTTPTQHGPTHQIPQSDLSILSFILFAVDPDPIPLCSLREYDALRRIRFSLVTRTVLSSAIAVVVEVAVEVEIAVEVEVDPDCNWSWNTDCVGGATSVSIVSLSPPSSSISVSVSVSVPKSRM